MTLTELWNYFRGKVYNSFLVDLIFYIKILQLTLIICLLYLTYKLLSPYIANIFLLKTQSYLISEDD